MKKCILFSLLFHLTGFVFSQPVRFQITYGTSTDDWGRAMPTSDGGYILLMDDVTNPSLKNIAVIKLDSIGNMTWNRTYGGTTNTDDGHIRIIEAHNGGYLISGIIDMGTSAIPVWIRIDNAGDTVWVKKHDCGNNFVKTSDGGYAHLGGIIIKSDSLGNIQWAKRYLDLGSVSSGEQTYDGGYIVMGLTQQYASGGINDRDFILFKTDSVGNLEWSKTYGRPTTLEYSSKVIQTTDGGYLILGQTGPASQSQLLDAILIKTDSAGNLQWSKTYTGLDSDKGIDIKKTGAIGYIIIGHTIGFESTQNSLRTFLVRTDGLGNPVWSKVYGDVINNPMNSDDVPVSVYFTADGGFLISGWSRSFGAGGYDTWLVKTDGNGVSGCNEINELVTVGVPALTITSAGTDSTVICTSSPYTVSIGTWQPMQTILCLSGPPPVGSGTEIENLEVMIYPNPTSGIFILQSDQGNVELEIYNTLGENIYFSSITNLPAEQAGNLITINLSEAASGIYLVRIITAEGTATKKIIKE